MKVCLRVIFLEHGIIFNSQFYHFYKIKGTCSQSYVFSSSHVGMWEVDRKEGWVPGNWCFQIMVLEKALESPLDCKEIKSVNPGWYQSWIFIGRTHAEAEAPVHWPLDGKSWLIGKDPDAGKNWRQEKKGTTEDEVVGWHHSLDGHEFEQGPGDGEEQESLVCCSPWGHKESDMADNWTELNSFMKSSIILAVKKNLF